MSVRVYAILYREDDPSKNTALKMVREGLAQVIKKRDLRGTPLVLNPFSKVYLGHWLREWVARFGIVVVDASWRMLSGVKFKGIKGVHVKLPPLLAGNPINYAKPCILSSVEAVAAALYITGFTELYEKYLGLYKWMSTFHHLNAELLEVYSKAENVDELVKTIVDYWGDMDPCDISLTRVIEK